MFDRIMGGIESLVILPECLATVVFSCEVLDESSPCGCRLQEVKVHPYV